MSARADGTRWVVVTGASAGIGRACVRRLASRGFGVIAGVYEEGMAEAVEREGNAAAQAAGSAGAAGTGGAVHAVRFDVTRDEEIASAAAEIGRIAGPALWGLVNCAGMGVVRPLATLEAAALRRQLEVNVIGPAMLTRALLPLLRPARSTGLTPGRIVNVSSALGRLSLPFTWPYCASKHALEAMSDGWRLELRRAGVAVVAVRPGRVATRIWEQALADPAVMLAQVPERQRWMYERALKRTVRRGKQLGPSGLAPEAVAKVIVAALEARRPKPRYVVGWDAWALGVMGRVLPAAWMDELVAKALHAR